VVKASDFNTEVSLPAGLDVPVLRRAIEYIEREMKGLVDLCFEQANVFSAVVGIFGVRALDSNSVYEKSKHSQTAQQRFPDLRRRGVPDPLPPDACLESKASKRPWEVQSHFNHSGWYIVWRYLVDPTETIETGKPVIIWRVDIVKLNKNDWEYQGSKAGEGKGGRTHTFGVKNPAKKLRGRAIYQRTDIVVRGGKPVPKNGD